MAGVNDLRGVTCGECRSSIVRRPMNPNTGLPIKTFFCNTACKALFQKRARPVSDEWLRQKYEDERRSCVEIAKIVGRDPKRVFEWIKDAGIATRKRGDPSNGCHSFRLGDVSPFKGKIQKRGNQSPHWQGGITPERQSFYASPEWKAAVREVYGRDKKICRRCGISQCAAAKQGHKMHVHHVVGFRVKHLRCELSNLVLLCKGCHLFVHSKANAMRQFRGGKLYEGGRPNNRKELGAI